MVIDSMDTNLKKGQLLSEDDYEKAVQEYGPHFKVGMGGSAIRDLIKSIDVDFMAKKLRKTLEKSLLKFKSKK